MVLYYCVQFTSLSVHYRYSHWVTVSFLKYFKSPLLGTVSSCGFWLSVFWSTLLGSLPRLSAWTAGHSSAKAQYRHFQVSSSGTYAGSLSPCQNSRCQPIRRSNHSRSISNSSCPNNDRSACHSYLPIANSEVWIRAILKMATSSMYFWTWPMCQIHCCCHRCL